MNVILINQNQTDARYELSEDGICQTLTARCGTGGGHVPMILETLSIGNGQLHQISMEPVARPLDCMHDQQAILQPAKTPRKFILRRLIPLECIRLQGLPDWWCDGVNGSDSAVYKMCGNGLAIPCAYDVMRRIAKALGGEKQ